MIASYAGINPLDADLLERPLEFRLLVVPSSHQP
jgi:hypothetical protein